MMRSSVWLKQISRYEPDIFNACQEAYVNSERNGNYLSPNPSKFLSCPPNSIDYAVMEPTSSNRDDMTENWVVPLNVGWSDLGTWKSIWEKEIKDPDGNFTHGNTILESVTNSLVVSDHRAVAVTDVSDLAIVETDDAILVSSLNGISELKKLIDSIEKSDQELLFKRNYEEKPWGNFTILASGWGFQIKLLTVNPQSSTSLQSHQYRSEHWVIIKGISKITKGSEHLELSQNESVFIPAGERHRIENHTGEVVQMIEVQIGTYYGEDDIIRYEDMYGRV